MNIPFEEAYVLHMSEAKKRYELLKNNHKKYNVDEKFKIWWTTRRFGNRDMLLSCETMRTKPYDIVKTTRNKSVYSSVFNCTYEHYSIIKQAFLRGISSVLITEDDVILTGDKELVQRVFDNIPQDYNIIRFCVIPEHTKYKNKGEFFTKNNYRQNWGMQAYALDRKGMEYYITMCENIWAPADMPLFAVSQTSVNKILKMYFCNYEIFKLNEESNNSVIIND